MRTKLSTPIVIHLCFAFVFGFTSLLNAASIVDQSPKNIQLNPAISLWARDISSQMVGKSADLPQIVCSGTSVHAIWRADSANVRYIVYNRSLDNGATWEEPRIVFTYPSHEGGGAGDGGDLMRKMTVNAGGVHIFLGDYGRRSTWYGRLAYVRSTNNGASFEAARFIFDANDAFHVRNIIPRSTAGMVSVCFLHKCNWDAIDTCYVMSSTDNGSTFRRDSVYTSASGGGSPDDYWTDGTRHYVVFSWAYFYYGFQEGRQYIASSTNAAKSFTITSLSMQYAGKYKTFMANPDFSPNRIAVAGQNVYVMSYEYPNAATGRLYINRSTDNGASFSQSTVAIDSNRAMPEQSNITAAGAYVYVATALKGDQLILFSSSNSGQSFGTSRTFTTNSNTNSSLVATSAYPMLFVDPTVAGGRVLHIAHHGGRYAYSDDGGATVKAPVMILPFSLRSWHQYNADIDAQGQLHYAQSAGNLYMSSGQTDVDIWYRRYNYRTQTTTPGSGNRCLVVTNKQATADGDHQNDYVSLPCTDPSQFAASFTVDFRFKYSAKGENNFVILIKPAGDSHASGTYHFSLSGGSIVASVRPRGQAALSIWTPQALTPDQWYHVALSVDTSSKTNNITLYLNGQLASSTSAPNGMMTSYDPHSIGYIYNNGYTEKQFAIDEIHMWKRALTQTEIAAVMNSTPAVTTPGLIASYSFDGTMSDATGQQGNGVPLYKERFAGCNESIFFVARCAPVTAGNTGDVTLTISGGGFATGVHARLRKDSNTVIEASELRIVSPSLCEATFDLRSAALAKWTLELWNDHDTAVLIKAVDVRQGEIANPWVSINGRNLFLVNRWTNYTMYVGNTANVDATGVPIWLAVSNSPDVEIEFTDFEVEYSDFVKQKGYEQQLSTLPLYIEANSIDGKPFNAKVYGFYLARVPAGTVQTYHFRVRSSRIQQIELRAWANPPLFQSPLNFELASCIISAVTERVVDNMVTVIPTVGCVYSIAKLAYNPFNSYKVNGKRTVLSTVRELSGTLLDCTMNLNVAWAATRGVVKFVSDIDQYVNDIRDCKKRFARKGMFGGIYDIVGSIDPNSITGPPGYGEERYTSGSQVYSYSINFENKSSATAPAHQVVVLDTLDVNRFDLTTFRFGSCSIADTTVTLPYSADALSTLIDLRPRVNTIARVDASVDAQKGIIQWVFSSLDPQLLQPTDEPMGGFLPPNKTAPEGEGMVSYSVALRPYLAHKSTLPNVASIVFDQNAAIRTNTFVNTLDKVAPQSKVTTLSITNDTTLGFQWTASDDGSGVRDVQVWMSIHDSAYAPIVGSTGTGASFGFYQKGTGRSFRFYTVARDMVDNEESSPSYPDLSDVDEPTLLPSVPCILGVMPHPLRTSATAMISVPENSVLRVSLYDLLGTEIQTLRDAYTPAGVYEVRLDAESLASGVYVLSVNDGRLGCVNTTIVVMKE